MKQTPLNKVSAKKLAKNGGKPIYSTLSRSSKNAVEAPERPAPPSKPRPPIKKRGKVSKRTQGLLDACYAVVDERSGGVCEVPDCERLATNHHHLLCRNSNPTLRADARNVVHLCRECHDRAHRNMMQFRWDMESVIPGFIEIYDCKTDRARPQENTQ